MSDNPVIAVGGENLMDYVSDEGAVVACPGGAAFNVALALGRQGAAVRYVSPISTDAAGERLALLLGDAGVTLTGGRSPRPTSEAHVTVSRSIPSYRFDRSGTAERDVTQDGLSDAIGTEARVLHTGGLALADGPDADIWVQACGRAWSEGRLVSLDLNIRLAAVADMEAYRARLQGALRHAHVVKMSDEDALALYPDGSLSEAVETIRLATQASLLVLTCGADGATAWTPHRQVTMPARSVSDVVDTVGAGDTFIATLLAGLVARDCLTHSSIAEMSRADLEAVMDRASRAAALTCGRQGCDPPDRAALEP